MRSLDDVWVERLLQLDSDLSEHNLYEFMEFVRTSYCLDEISYVSHSFHWGSSGDRSLGLIHSAPGAGSYRERAIEFADAVAALGIRSAVPLDWRTVSKTAGQLGQLFEAATRAGFWRQGLTIPVRDPDMRICALFSAAADENDECWASRRLELTRDLVHVAHYVHQRVRELHSRIAPEDVFGETGNEALSELEIEALQLEADGRGLAEIGVAMRVSAETAKAFLESSRYKLKALNRHHAVVKALRAGLIR